MTTSSACSNSARIDLRLAASDSDADEYLAADGARSRVDVRDIAGTAPIDKQIDKGAEWAEIRPLLRYIVQEIGPKVAAEALGFRDDVSLFHAIEERERHVLKAWHFVWLLVHAKNHVALSALNNACGCDDAIRRDRLSDAEMVQHFIAAVLSMPAEMAEGFLALARLTPSDLHGAGRVAPKRCGG